MDYETSDLFGYQEAHVIESDDENVDDPMTEAIDEDQENAIGPDEAEEAPS